MTGQDKASTERLLLTGGRELEVHHLSTGNQTLVLCHAAPGSGCFDPDPDATAESGVALIAPDRPGYGGSSPLQGAWSTPASAADDIAAILERLGTGPVGIAGWSAGGRVAAALAARRPDLVRRLAIIATPAPDDAVPWVPPQHRAALEAMRGQPPSPVHQQLAAMLAPMRPANFNAPEALASLGATPSDQAALASRSARVRLAAMLAHSWRQGAAGMAADIAGYTLRPWGFDAQAVAVETLLLYGGADAIAGKAHGDWWASQISHARFEVIDDAGHLLIIPCWRRVLAFLIE